MPIADMLEEFNKLHPQSNCAWNHLHTSANPRASYIGSKNEIEEQIEEYLQPIYSRKLHFTLLQL